MPGALNEAGLFRLFLYDRSSLAVAHYALEDMAVQDRPLPDFIFFFPYLCRLKSKNWRQSFLRIPTSTGTSSCYF